ncbi:MAG: sigma-70 family RNA polymerase sigma factor [Planctomycetales bacterium]|nr:sigma-70 family RNA polymerase sigma factor [Planctomycetales bacterium]
MTESTFQADSTILLRQAVEGHVPAQVQLFNQYEPRLRRLLVLRLDRRLQGRLDASDVLQETYIEYARCIQNYEQREQLPFYLWLRMVTLRKLIAMQRRFLGTAARDVNREISLNRGPLPMTSSCSLAASFVGHLTSPSQAAIRTELQLRIQDTLNDMDAMDREVLSLRHFEQLSNLEVAQLLQLSPAASSNRYIRALKRLRPMLQEIIASERDCD